MVHKTKKLSAIRQGELARRDELKFLLNRISDININRPDYKRKVIEEIKKSDFILPIDKKRFLKTARGIPADSWTWKKSWDKGKIF